MIPAHQTNGRVRIKLMEVEILSRDEIFDGAAAPSHGTASTGLSDVLNPGLRGDWDGLEKSTE